ncbi:uncharacterized protein BXZ73DRAFT_105999 [Epithele typhae]|uniref:uncharacterized protein n=1 Tax=Epithele typhae TaxID=378194 RepID=UPI002007E76B|nr:uncharacterized protein BXZ73DRAFT_105999 [Epithele typhae]KAH9915932.1 hypothetical protein BXZ73DRAFT_105999 [Epithele typhae]
MTSHSLAQNATRAHVSAVDMRFPPPQKTHRCSSSTLSPRATLPFPSIHTLLSLTTDLNALTILVAPTSFALGTLPVSEIVRKLTLG